MAVLVVSGMVAARLVRLPAEDVLGVVSGITGNPAIKAYAGKLAGSDRPDVVYATVFPTTTILKILFVQIAATLIGRS
jgi:putative transport protein